MLDQHVSVPNLKLCSMLPILEIEMIRVTTHNIGISSNTEVLLSTVMLYGYFKTSLNY